jgi:hypothetical protein
LKGIAGTGFLVAFVNWADEPHDWAVSIAEQVTEPLLCQRLACFSISGFSFSAFLPVPTSAFSPVPGVLANRDAVG